MPRSKELMAATILDSFTNAITTGMVIVMQGKLDKAAAAKAAQKEEREIFRHNELVKTSKMREISNLKDIEYMTENREPVILNRETGEFVNLYTNTPLKKDKVFKTSDIMPEVKPGWTLKYDQVRGVQTKVKLNKQTGKYDTVDVKSAPLPDARKMSAEEEDNFQPFAKVQYKAIDNLKKRYATDIKSTTDTLQDFRSIKMKLDQYNEEDGGTHLDIFGIAGTWAEAVNREKGRKTNEDVQRAIPVYAAYEAAHRFLERTLKKGGKLTQNEVNDYRKSLDLHIGIINNSIIDIYKQTLRSESRYIPMSTAAQRMGKPMLVEGPMSNSEWDAVVNEAREESKYIPGKRTGRQPAKAAKATKQEAAKATKQEEVKAIKQEEAKESNIITEDEVLRMLGK